MCIAQCALGAHLCNCECKCILARIFIAILLFWRDYFFESEENTLSQFDKETCHNLKFIFEIWVRLTHDLKVCFIKLGTLIVVTALQIQNITVHSKDCFETKSNEISFGFFRQKVEFGNGTWKHLFRTLLVFASFWPHHHQNQLARYKEVFVQFYWTYYISSENACRKFKSK